jgi:REP element-mobilizing transposase RayT
MPLISAEWESALYAYIAGIIRNLEGEPIAIGGITDHVHILCRLTLKIPFPDFMRELKASSSRWVRQNHQPRFSWQRRYGAFTVSESVSPAVRKYIQEQKQHHGRQTFGDEYVKLLRRHGVEFDERFVWE